MRRRISRKNNLLIRRILVLAILLIVVAILLTSCSKNKENLENIEEELNSEVIVEGIDFSRIYYPDTENTYLYSEVKPINRPNIEEAIIKVFDELKAGPQQERLKKIISENVKVLSVKVEENICTIDLSQEFIDENTDNSTMRLYSVVNSICALPVVDLVKINIEGNESAVLGEYSLKDVFEENANIVF